MSEWLDFSIFATPEGWISLVTLAALEIVLGIDNIVFISILTDKLPAEKQASARRLGLAFALITRLGLLFAISWIMRLTKPLFTVMDVELSGKSLILLVGGLFLIAKSTYEIFENMEVSHEQSESKRRSGSAAFLIGQIMVLDIVFSLDSVITAVGMAKSILIMALAMIAAMIVMLLFANAVGNFVSRHPSMKILALAFLLLIGALLVAEGFGQHIPKGYIYFAMSFSLVVELINMRVRKARKKPVNLNNRYGPEPS